MGCDLQAVPTLQLLFGDLHLETYLLVLVTGREEEKRSPWAGLLGLVGRWVKGLRCGSGTAGGSGLGVTCPQPRCSVVRADQHPGSQDACGAQSLGGTLTEET